MTYASAAIVNAIVELHRLIPVVLRRIGIEAVVARCLGRIFAVWRRGRWMVTEIRVQRLSLNVIEIILGRKCLRRVVVLTQIAYTSRTCV